MKPDTVRTSIDVPRELHRRLKKAAAERGCSARQLILRSLETAVSEPAPFKAPRRLDLRNKPLIPSTGKPLDLNKIRELIEDVF